jgi:glycosyltransferase involved in cell wall biosynthesis
MDTRPLFFAGQPGEAYGWGICNKYLLRELAKLTCVRAISETSAEWHSQSLPGDLFTPLQDHDLNPATPAHGFRNYGYTFFEHELTDKAVVNAQRFDAVFAGSTWCRQRLQEKGIANGVVLIQGIDTELFHVDPIPGTDAQFLVFSGGKFELRKGQDLVLRAMQHLQQKYPDIMLVNAWFNQWPASLQTMVSSPHIRFEARPGSWLEQMRHLYCLNGLTPDRVITMPLLPQAKMAQIYHLTDVGLFPNRCEGGTNLVMMEYMACGKPVIATYGSGHCDVITEANALLLKSLRPFNVLHPSGQLQARWHEPFLDEIIAQVEYAYHHRDHVRRLGLQAAENLKQFTWERTARTIVRTLGQQ